MIIKKKLIKNKTKSLVTLQFEENRDNEKNNKEKCTLPDAE